MAPTVFSHSHSLDSYHDGPSQKCTKSPQMECVLVEAFPQGREQQDDQWKVRQSVLSREK